jgi:hypothetical protein
VIGAEKGPAFFAYSNSYLIDVTFGAIVDVEASGAIRPAEVGAEKTMIERIEDHFGLKWIGLRPVPRCRSCSGTTLPIMFKTLKMINTLSPDASWLVEEKDAHTFR